MHPENSINRLKIRLCNSNLFSANETEIVRQKENNAKSDQSWNLTIHGSAFTL